MKEHDDPRPIGELEPPPTPEGKRVDEDPTILARWLYRAYEQGPIFWLFLGGLAVLFTGLGVVVSSLSAAKSVTSQAWIDLVPAKTAEDRLKIADQNPKTPVADWARLQAAFEEYQTGLTDLTESGRRESAGPRLKRALDLFSQVAREAPHDSPQSRGAAFAVARVLEARNELPEAIKQYRLVADTWKDSPEARQSLALAKTLEDPDSVQFYKELYTARASFNPPAGAGLIPPGMPMPSTTVAPGQKPTDLLIPGTSKSGKSFLPDIPGPAGIDPPPPSTPLIPAPSATSATAPAPAPATGALPDKPLEAPRSEPTAPAPK